MELSKENIDVEVLNIQLKNIAGVLEMITSQVQNLSAAISSATNKTALSNNIDTAKYFTDKQLDEIDEYVDSIWYDKYYNFIYKLDEVLTCEDFKKYGYEFTEDEISAAQAKYVDIDEIKLSSKVTLNDKTHNEEK